MPVPSTTERDLTLLRSLGRRIDPSDPGAHNNLGVLYYEKGLLAPGVDYDAPHPYLKSICDKLGPDGYITMPKAPGMGYEIVWDYINDNIVKP